MKEVAFHYHDPKARKPIVFETIFAEKNGGGIVANCKFDLREGTAMGMNEDGQYAPIKCAYVNYASPDNFITVKKGHNFVAGDFVGYGKKSVTVISVSEDTDYDVLTLSATIAGLDGGHSVYQAKSASASSASPVYVPEYLLGQDIPAESGDVLAKLVNGANINKATAPVSDDIVALMKSIFKI